MRACAWCSMAIGAERGPCARYCGSACRDRANNSVRPRASADYLVSSLEADAVIELRVARRAVRLAADRLRESLGLVSRPAPPEPERIDAWAGYVSTAGWDS